MYLMQITRYNSSSCTLKNKYNAFNQIVIASIMEELYSKYNILTIPQDRIIKKENGGTIIKIVFWESCWITFCINHKKIIKIRISIYFYVYNEIQNIFLKKDQQIFIKSWTTHQNGYFGGRRVLKSSSSYRFYID